MEMGIEGVQTCWRGTGDGSNGGREYGIGQGTGAGAGKQNGGSWSSELI